MAQPRARISPPLLSAPKVGLLASIAPTTPTGPDGQPARWEFGFAFEPELCDATGRVSIACLGDVAARDPAAQPDTVSVDPYMVWAADECSTYENARDQQGRALRALKACLSSEIEAELWTGSLAKAATPDLPTPWLASATSDVLSPGSGLTPLEALACLEQGLGQSGCGQGGVIHATRQTVTHWADGGALIKEGTVLRTVMGTLVIPGAGYDGSDPDGNAASAGAVWAYGTGPVVVHVGEAELTTAFQQDTNLRTVFAQAVAVAYFDPGCTHLAVQVDLDPCAFAGAGS